MYIACIIYVYIAGVHPEIRAIELSHMRVANTRFNKFFGSRTRSVFFFVENGVRLRQALEALGGSSKLLTIVCLQSLEKE